MLYRWRELKKGLKNNEKGISLLLEGKFHIVERNCNISFNDDDKIEIKILKEIIDKKGNKVPIITLQKHIHSFKAFQPDNQRCWVEKCHCGEVKSQWHEWEYINSHEEFHIRKCKLCGYSYTEPHTTLSFTCSCGKEVILLPSREEFKKEKERFRELIQKYNELIREEFSIEKELNKINKEIKQLEIDEYIDLKFSILNSKWDIQKAHLRWAKDSTLGAEVVVEVFEYGPTVGIDTDDDWLGDYKNEYVSYCYHWETYSFKSFLKKFENYISFDPQEVLKALYLKMKETNERKKQLEKEKEEIINKLEELRQKIKQLKDEIDNFKFENERMKKIAEIFYYLSPERVIEEVEMEFMRREQV